MRLNHRSLNARFSCVFDEGLRVSNVNGCCPLVLPGYEFSIEHMQRAFHYGNAAITQEARSHRWRKTVVL